MGKLVKILYGDNFSGQFDQTKNRDGFCTLFFGDGSNFIVWDGQNFMAEQWQNFIFAGSRLKCVVYIKLVINCLEMD